MSVDGVGCTQQHLSQTRLLLAAKSTQLETTRSEELVRNASMNKSHRTSSAGFDVGIILAMFGLCQVMVDSLHEW